MNANKKKSIYAFSVLSGTIIGVGLFSLPYIAIKSGILLTLGYFVFLGIVAIIIHRFFAEVAFKTPNFLRLSGFAKIHLGSIGEKTAIFSTTLGLFGSTLAYLIVGSEFLKSLLMPVLGGSDIVYVLCYFFFGALFIYFGIKSVSKIEFFGIILFFFILIAVFFQSKSVIDFSNLFSTKAGNFFFPYGPILFSLWGASLIPEIEEMIGKNKDLLKKVISLSIIVPILIYLLFIFMVVGICGSQTTELALSGLSNFLGNGTMNALLLFGIFATFTSFITLGLTLKKIFWYDMGIRKNTAWMITCFVPLILFLAGLRSFIDIIGLVGGVMIGIDAVLILLMYKKINQKSILVYPLAVVFIIGIIYEIIYFIK